MDDLNEHATKEETRIFPAMREKMNENSIKLLATAITVGKSGAPTRPHPESTLPPPFNWVMSPVAAVMDRLRDSLGIKGEIPIMKGDVNEELRKQEARAQV
jgi:hypothetical protein